MRIRQSTLGQADDCLRKMQYSLEQPPEHYLSGSLRAVGTGYHSARELQYRWRLDLPTPTSVEVRNEALIAEAQASFDSEVDRAGERFLWDDKVPDVATAHQLLATMESSYRDQNIEWPDTYEVLAVEQRFELPWLNDHVRAGTIDLVLRDPNGCVLGVDHKTAGRMWPTGKEHPRKNNQAAWYVNALTGLYPDAPSHAFVFDILTYAGKFDRRVVIPEARHLAAVDDKARQVAVVYTAMREAGIDLPANPSSTLCSPKYCDFFSICPHGSVLE